MKYAYTSGALAVSAYIAGVTASPVSPRANWAPGQELAPGNWGPNTNTPSTKDQDDEIPAAAVGDWAPVPGVQKPEPEGPAYRPKRPTSDSSETLTFINHCSYPLYYWPVLPAGAPAPLDSEAIKVPAGSSGVHHMIDTAGTGGVVLKIRDRPYYSESWGIIQAEYNFAGANMFYDLSFIDCDSKSTDETAHRYCPFGKGGVWYYSSEVPTPEVAQCLPAHCTLGQEGKCMGIYMVHGAWNGEPTLSCPRDGRNYFVETCTDNPGQRSAPGPAFSSSSTPVSQSSYSDSDSESYPTTESTTTTSTNEDDGEVEQSTWVKPAWNSLWGPVADWTTWAPDALYSFPVLGWPVRKPIGPKTGDGAPVEDPARIAIEGQEQGQEWPVEYGPGPVVPGPGSAKWEGVAPASPPTAPQSPEGQEQVQEFKEDSAPAYAPAPIIPADRWTDAAPRNYLLPSPSPSSPSPSPKSSDWKPSSRLGSSSSIQDVGAESMQARNLPSIPVKPSAGYGRF